MTLPTQTLGRQQSEGGKYSGKIDMLVYGRSGAGKTYFTSSAPGPIYLATPDPTGHRSYPFPVDGVVINHTDQLREVVTGIRQGGHGYNTLVVDGLSWLHDLLVGEMGQYFHDQMGAKDPDLMPIQARMKISNQFRRMIRTLVNLTQLGEDSAVHVIFCTLEERLKEDDEAPFQVRPLVGSQKMNEVFPAFFSIIGYIAPVGNVDEEGNPDPSRKMLFTEHKGILARDRLGVFPSMGLAPNLSNYLE